MHFVYSLGKGYLRGSESQLPVVNLCSGGHLGGLLGRRPGVTCTPVLWGWRARVVFQTHTLATSSTCPLMSVILDAAY